MIKLCLIEQTYILLLTFSNDRFGLKQKKVRHKKSLHV